MVHAADVCEKNFMSLTSQNVSAIGRPIAAVPNELICRLSVQQYHEIVRAGILTDDDPIELLDGWLVYKMPKSRPHSIATRRIRELIQQKLPGGWYVDSQEPITTDESEPEPDVSVIRGQPDDYPNRHPGPQDIALLVEVADATLDRDRGLKKRLYARAGVAVYWIVNLPDEQVEVYSHPTGPAPNPDYHQRQDYGRAQMIPLILDGCEIARVDVGHLLP